MPARSLLLGVVISAVTAAVLAAQSRPGAATAAPAASFAQPALAGLPALPPAPRLRQDPADSLYRLAREAVRREDFARSADLFRELWERYPDSDYASDAMYWEAFSRFRRGGADDLREARLVLDRQAERHPDAARRGDAPSLRARIEGALANRGDADAAVRVYGVAEGGSARGGGRGTAGASGQSGGSAGGGAAGMGGSSASSGQRGATAQPGACPSERDDERIAALNALLQMDSERAMPILERVLARRDDCSATLRRKAVFLVSQKSGARREELLLSAVRSDPDAQVREQAVFWLSQTKSERATEILEELLRTSTDDRVRDKAIFALSQQDTPRARRALRGFAERADAPKKLREQAIFWIGQESSAEDAAYLQQLYGRLDDAALKEKILFSLSQRRGVGSEQWLLRVARDRSEPAALRGKALFWLGQGNLVTTAELGGLYEQLDDAVIKDQLIFALSQRANDRAAVDKLMDVARRETNPKLRERAIFWLGQSNDPRVPEFLLELIDR